jgi:putative membrane protein
MIERIADVLAGAMLVVAVAGYLAAAGTARRAGRWPAYRGAFWCTGLGVLAVALLGPLAEAADRDFTAHVAQHLLLGMLAPLLLMLAAPLTLALRALPRRYARRLSRLGRSWPVRFLSHPVTAGALGAGGLWLFYTTRLYPAVHDDPVAHLAAHAHFLLAGYLFTFAIAGVDPAPHRAGYGSRAVVLVGYLAAHGILAKYLYGHPPADVPVEQGQRGAILMYYGGDGIDLGLTVAFCRQWFARTGPARPGTSSARGRRRPESSCRPPCPRAGNPPLPG